MARLFPCAVAMTLCLGVFLAACQQTTKVAMPDTSKLPTVTQVDAKIAQVSQQLAQQCATLQTMILVAGAFDARNKYEKVIKAASAARDAYCNSAPPSDVDTAALAVAQMAIAINEALKQPKPAQTDPASQTQPHA